jgi:hypothetical protein
LLDADGDLKSSTTADRQKYRNLASNPHCDLFIIDPTNPYRTLEVRAEAELAADADHVLLAKLAAHYGVDAALLVSPGEDRRAITFRPRRVVANPPAPR